MANIWKKVGTTGHTNKEGFPSYKGDAITELVNVLMTGSTANTFYVRAESQIERFVEMFKEFPDPEFMAKAIVYAREKGYNREIPIAAAVALSTKDLNLFKRIVHRVCKNPKDWQKLIDISRSGVFRKGLGRALKRELIKAIENADSYHAMKYPKAMRDMINISRPRESTNPTVIRYIKGKDVDDPRLAAVKELRHMDDGAVYRTVRELRLPYEVVTGSVKKMTPKIWEALLYVAPYFNLLRNLRNFMKNGVFDNRDNLDYAVARLTDRESIRKAMIFPFRFIAAYRSLEDTYNYVLASQDATNIYIIEEIRDALIKAAEISLENVPDIPGKVAIATDVSGSMDSHLTGDLSSIRAIDIAGIFTAILLKRCNTIPVILPFDSHVRLEMAKKVLKDRNENILSIADNFHTIGGTSLSAPVEYLLDNDIKVDTFIGITDDEEWVGRRFIDALKEYMQKINPEVRVYLVTLIPYGDYPTPTDMPNVHYIFGWSDTALRYITSGSINKQIEEIENIQL